MNISQTFKGAAVVASFLLMTGCAVYSAQGGGRGYGPPPHAPAHGYRHHYENHDLVYDAGLGVYLVVGLPDYYFLDNSYYRYSGNGWYYSKQVDRDWQRYQPERLPPGLAKKYHGNQGGHGNEQGRDHDDDRGNGNGHGHDKGRGNDHH